MPFSHRHSFFRNCGISRIRIAILKPDILRVVFVQRRHKIVRNIYIGFVKRRLVWTPGSSWCVYGHIQSDTRNKHFIMLVAVTITFEFHQILIICRRRLIINPSLDDHPFFRLFQFQRLIIWSPAANELTWTQGTWRRSKIIYNPEEITLYGKLLLLCVTLLWTVGILDLEDIIQICLCRIIYQDPSRR